MRVGSGGLLSMKSPNPGFSKAGSLRRLLLALFSVCFTLLCLEGIVRMVAPQDLKYWDSSDFRRILPTTPHFVENIPNAASSFLGVPVTINDIGLRGKAIQQAKPPGTFRVLVVGDSITFGYGVKDTEAYPQALERLLNRDCQGRYEVLNGGALGGGLGDYYHFLTTKGQLLQPDLLIIGIALNDILPYAESGATGEQSAEFAMKSSWIRRLNHFLLTHSHLYVFSYSRVKSWLYASRLLDINQIQGWNLVALKPPSPAQTMAWQHTYRMLAKIIDYSTANHLPVVLVVFPLRMQMSPPQLKLYRDRYHLEVSSLALDGDPQRRLNEFATTAHVPLIDLLPVFRAYPAEEIYFHNARIRDDAAHLSPVGHQIAAETMRDKVPGICDQSVGRPGQQQLKSAYQ
jgi:lysophospholipase L1-like esterase